MDNINSIFLTDGYKLSHPQQYPKGTVFIMDNFTPRSDNHAPKVCQGKGVVVFGVQMGLQWLKEHFDQNFFFTAERLEYGNPNASQFQSALNAGELEKLKKRAIDPIKKEFSMYLNSDYDTSYFEELWDIGYLPIEVRALEEGTVCPIRVPMLTICNTKEEFFWLPNFLETILSQLLWKPMTSATIALAYRKIMTKWALKTNPQGIEAVTWQGHDFSMRGLDSVYATMASGLGHLTSFSGTDSLPTIPAVRHYYDEVGFVAGSVPATEHSVMCAGSKDDEKGTYLRLLETYPTGILSVVSDTWDLWNVITKILPELKDKIMARDGKLVIRPDSGDPADILCGINIKRFDDMEDLEDGLNDYFWDIFSENCDSDGYMDKDDVYASIGDQVYHVTGIADIGKMHDMNDNDHYVVDDVDLKIEAIELKPSQKGVIELLWETFGGTVNEEGYKILDSHIGAIYGDSITPDRAEDILSRLEAKGFASTNVVLGIGSFTYQYNTRDTFGYAMKATYVERRVSTYDEKGEVDGYEDIGESIFKDPVTDSGMKKSARGLVAVVANPVGGQPILVDECTWETVLSDANLLKTVFLNGEFVKRTTFSEIRTRINKLV